MNNSSASFVIDNIHRELTFTVTVTVRSRNIPLKQFPFKRWPKLLPCGTSLAILMPFWLEGNKVQTNLKKLKGLINNSASINRVCFCQDRRCCVNGYQVIKGRDSSIHGDGVTDGGKAFPWESEQNQGQFPVSRRDGGSSQYIDSKSAAKVRSAISALFLGLLHTDPQTWWANKTKQKTCAKFQLGRSQEEEKSKSLTQLTTSLDKDPFCEIVRKDSDHRNVIKTSQ